MGKACDCDIAWRSNRGKSRGLVAGKFGERGVHLVGQGLVAIFVEAEFVWNGKVEIGNFPKITKIGKNMRRRTKN